MVHPAHLDETLKSAWGQVLGDYQIIPPFAQLGRHICRPDPADLESTEITRYRGPKIPGIVMYGMLERSQWLRDTPADGGGFSQHSKHFPVAGLTAFITYTGLSMGYHEEKQELEAGVFRPRPYQADLVGRPQGSAQDQGRGYGRGERGAAARQRHGVEGGMNRADYAAISARDSTPWRHNQTSPSKNPPRGRGLQRPAAEVLYADELNRLAEADAARPTARLAALAAGVLSSSWATRRSGIAPKFVGRRAMLERCVVALATNRGLMLIGEPGTAKSCSPSCSRRRSPATRR